MVPDITLDALKLRKCILCGDQNKSIATIMSGQIHIATVTTCCNCGFTMTFSHSAQEYANYIQTGEGILTSEICTDPNCKNQGNCTKRMKGRKI